MSFKLCCTCKKEKDTREFGKCKSQKDALNLRCKNCHNTASRKYQKENIKLVRARKKKYRLSHKDYYRKKSYEFSKTSKGYYNRYKSSSTIRKHKFLLTFDQFMEYWQKPCYYCGSVIKTIGLDRIDNAIGYIYENIVTCCTFCNRMKYTHTTEEFIHKIKQIYNKLVKGKENVSVL